jgi:hypothetical protein
MGFEFTAFTLEPDIYRDRALSGEPDRGFRVVCFETVPDLAAAAESEMRVDRNDLAVPEYGLRGFQRGGWLTVMPEGRAEPFGATVPHIRALFERCRTRFPC